MYYSIFFWTFDKAWKKWKLTDTISTTSLFYWILFIFPNIYMSQNSFTDYFWKNKCLIKFHNVFLHTFPKFFIKVNPFIKYDWVYRMKSQYVRFVTAIWQSIWQKYGEFLFFLKTGVPFFNSKFFESLSAAAFGVFSLCVYGHYISMYPGKQQTIRRGTYKWQLITDY